MLYFSFGQENLNCGILNKHLTWNGAEKAKLDLYLVSGPTGSARAPSLLVESRLANEFLPRRRTNSGFPVKYENRV